MGRVLLETFQNLKRLLGNAISKERVSFTASGKVSMSLVYFIPYPHEGSFGHDLLEYERIGGMPLRCDTRQTSPAGHCKSNVE
jgi:hypothetical protein